MTIEINEKGSEAFYKETVNAAAQYRYLLKNRNYKLKDYFSQFRTLVIASLAVFAVNAALMILWGAETYQIAVSAALLIAALMSVVYLASLKKAYKTMMTNPRNSNKSVLTLDDDGVELKNESTQTVRIARGNIAVIRTFKESLCFIPAAGAGVIISVNKKYADEILGWVRENWPGTDAA